MMKAQIQVFVMIACLEESLPMNEADKMESERVDKFGDYIPK